MRNNIILALCAIILVTTSCTATKRFNLSKPQKNQSFYRIEEDTQNLDINGIGEKKLVVYKLKDISHINMSKVSIGTDNVLYLKGLDEQFYRKLSDINSNRAFPIGESGFHYPEIMNGNEGVLVGDGDKVYLTELRTKKNGYKTGSVFKYSESEKVFKAVSIPFKFRFAKDSIAYQVTTGANVGIAIGHKITNYKYRPLYSPDDKLINHELVKNAYSIATFGGLTTISLNEKNTENLDGDRTVLGLTFGGMIVYSKDKLNIGAAAGFDIGFGNDAGGWRYQRTPWIGLVVALDFF